MKRALMAASVIAMLAGAPALALLTLAKPSSLNLNRVL
jgi:hypothetical protein